MIPHPFPLPQYNTPVLTYGHGRVQCTSHWLDAGPGWNKETCPWGEVGCRGWAPAPQPLGLHSAAVSRRLCLFVPRLHVWASRIYGIRGQVKGHSSQAKWEAKICETKEMTGQCQVKGQKSSERFSVDESEQPVCWLDHTPKEDPYQHPQHQNAAEISFPGIDPAREMGWAGIAWIRLQHWLWWCSLRLTEVDSIWGSDRYWQQWILRYFFSQKNGTSQIQILSFSR